MADWPTRYTADITWDGPGSKGGAVRAGLARHSYPESRRLLVDAMPTAGGDDTRHSPGDLVLAGLLDCYMQTFLAIVGKHDLPIESYRCSADGLVGPPAEKETPRLLSVVLRPVVTVAAGTGDKTRKRIETYLRRGLDFCYVSKSLTADITTDVTVE